MKKGDIVEIHNLTMSGKSVVEGKARLIRKLRDRTWIEPGAREYWLVRFIGDSASCTYPRWVNK